MNSEKLIEIVRSHPSLYDLSDPKYSDATHKDKLWKVIGKELNQPANACKTSWWDQCRKVLNKKKTSGEAATDMNIGIENLINSSTLTPMPTQQPNLSTFSKGGWKKNDKVKSLAVMMKYIIDKKLKEENDTIQKHHVDAFLTGIASTMKGLDPCRVNIAKTKIFSIVQELDMDQIMDDELEDEPQIPVTKFTNIKGSIERLHTDEPLYHNIAPKSAMKKPLPSAQNAEHVLDTVKCERSPSVDEIHAEDDVDENEDIVPNSETSVHGTSKSYTGKRVTPNADNLAVVLAKQLKLRNANNRSQQENLSSERDNDIDFFFKTIAGRVSKLPRKKIAEAKIKVLMLVSKIEEEDAQTSTNFNSI